MRCRPCKPRAAACARSAELLKLSRNTVRRILRAARAGGAGGGALRPDPAPICNRPSSALRATWCACSNCSPPNTISKSPTARSRAGCGRRGCARRLRAPGNITSARARRCSTTPRRTACASASKTVTAQCAGLVLAYSRRLFVQYYPRYSRFEAKQFLLEAARFMDGVCPVCIIDNTSVMLAGGAGENALIAPEMAAFARTLGFEFRAHRVGHPDRKGRIERNFFFVETNFLPGRSFTDFDDLNAPGARLVPGGGQCQPQARAGHVARGRLRDREAVPASAAQRAAPDLRGPRTGGGSERLCLARSESLLRPGAPGRPARDALQTSGPGPDPPPRGRGGDPPPPDRPARCAQHRSGPPSHSHPHPPHAAARNAAAARARTAGLRACPQATRPRPRRARLATGCSRSSAPTRKEPFLAAVRQAAALRPVRPGTAGETRSCNRSPATSSRSTRIPTPMRDRLHELLSRAAPARHRRRPGGRTRACRTRRRHRRPKCSGDCSSPKQAHRREQSLAYRLTQAKLPWRWTLDSFPFERQPGVDRSQIRALAGLDFLRRNENILLIGAPGTGKTGIAIALLREACLNAYPGRFYNAQAAARRALCLARRSLDTETAGATGPLSAPADRRARIPHPQTRAGPTPSSA
ncbi:MAG: ATP-binding protein [Marinilabiliales bacterium]|nr:ATP-binding protein [Marinilabiliales bacterium]